MTRAPKAASQPAISDWADEGAVYWYAVYDDPGIDGEIYRLRQARVLAAIDAGGLPEGARVLEIGPGGGLLTVELARRGNRVVCLDPAAPMLENTRTRARAEGLEGRVETVVADAHALPFSDASFDAVVAVGVLPWLSDPIVALREVRRVVAPGGLVVLTSDNSARLSFVLDPRLNPVAVAAAKRADAVLVRRLGTRSRRRGASLPRRYPNGSVDAMLARAGLVRQTGASVGFGPFTVLRRAVVPGRWAIPLSDRLQRFADAGVPGLRGGGAHYVVVARSPGV